MYIAKYAIFNKPKPGHITTFILWDVELEKNKNLTSYAMEKKRWKNVNISSR